jgi:transcriptional antiterminator
MRISLRTISWELIDINQWEMNKQLNSFIVNEKQYIIKFEHSLDRIIGFFMRRWENKKIDI